MDVQRFLERRDVNFEAMSHAPTFGAQHLAESMHVSGEQVAKAVLLRADDSYVLALVPATHHVDLKLAKRSIGAEVIALATERECGRHFTDCELGALPPFGSQYGIRTLLDSALLSEDLIFEGNSHNEAIRMSARDFKALEHPLVGLFSHHQ